MRKNELLHLSELEKPLIGEHVEVKKKISNVF
jgi:hypothetical protein